MLTTQHRIVFVDTETTDIEPHRAVPWEIALVIRDPGMLDVEEVHLIHIDALRADPDALTVGRYYDRHPCAAAPINGHVCPLPPRYVTLAGVAEATAGAVMVGNNVSYDLTVLGRHLDRPAAAWHYQPIDIKPLAAGWLAARGVSWEGVYPSTSQIADILGVPRPEDTRHTALGDARWVRDVYDTIMVA